MQSPLRPSLSPNMIKKRKQKKKNTYHKKSHLAMQEINDQLAKVLYVETDAKTPIL